MILLFCKLAEGRAYVISPGKDGCKMDKQSVCDNHTPAAKSAVRFNEKWIKYVECAVSSFVALTGLFGPVIRVGDSGMYSYSLWDALMAVFKGEAVAFYSPYLWIAGLIGVFSVIAGICCLAGVVKDNRSLCRGASVFLFVAIVIVLLLFSYPTTFATQIDFADYFGRDGLLSAGFWVPFVCSIVGTLRR